MTRPKKKGEKKEELISVQVEPSVKGKVERRAAKKKVSVGHYTREALEHYMDWEDAQERAAKEKEAA